MPISPSSLRTSCLPWLAAPNAAMSEICARNPDVQAWPPVLEYTWVSSTSTFSGLPAISARDRF